jgi:hypothetical protein
MLPHRLEQTEPDGHKLSKMGSPGRVFLEHRQLLFLGRARGQHHPAAGLELLDQGRRRQLGRRRDDDLVVGRMLGPPQGTIADADTDVVVAQPAQAFLGLGGEFLDDLDTPYPANQLAENGRLIPEAGRFRAPCRPASAPADRS